MPQLRQNIVTGEWVVIAPERAKRPSDFYANSLAAQPADAAKKSHPSPDPFAVGSDSWRHRIKDADTTHTYTVANKYPAFACDEKLCETRSYYPEGSFYRAKAAVGEHDVVVVKDGTLSIYTFPVRVWEDLFLAYQLRYLSYLRNPAIEHVMPIYNHGSAAGASIVHPHGQLFAGPIVPNYIEHELAGAERYYTNNGVNVFADLVTHELKEEVRILSTNKDFVAFTFFAARFPFEIWVVPTAQESHYATIKAGERKNLAKIMAEVIGMVGITLREPSLNFWIHSQPTTLEESRNYRWHLEIAPRVGGYGGFELGSGVVIDIMSPEIAAYHLRKK